MDLKRIRRNGFLPLVCVVLFASATPSYANGLNLIVNGSFEDPVVLANSLCGPFLGCTGYHNGVSGNDNIAGWQLIGKGGVDEGNVAIPGAPATMMQLGFNYAEPDTLSGQTLFFHPQDGFQSLDLTGEGNQGTSNGVKQLVGTDIGVHYLLSFWLGHQFSEAPGYDGLSALALYIDGIEIGSYTNGQNTAEDVTWLPFNYQFTASSSQTVIAFLNDTPDGNNFAGLDNVSLNAAFEPSSPVAVPESSSLLMMIIGVVLLGTQLRHRTSKSAPKFSRPWHDR